VDLHMPLFPMVAERQDLAALEGISRQARFHAQPPNLPRL
jgi:hypothetical protein